jgi:ATP/maltotriose-dependent transcriptional regulator MalT
VNVIVASRSGPPAAFSRLIVEEAIALVHWDQLRLTADEAEAIAVTRGIERKGDVARAEALASGWAESFRPCRLSERPEPDLTSHVAAQFARDGRLRSSSLGQPPLCLGEA